MSYASTLINDDFVWSAIMSAIGGRRRKNSGTRFINICCPMCVGRGESPDKRYRCGVKNDKGIGIYCYNCGFKTRWKPGQLLTRNIKDFLITLGMDDIDVKRLSHRAFVLSTMIQSSPHAQALADIDLVMKFPNRPMPKGAQSFEAWADKGCTDPRFLAVADYLFSRGQAIAAASTYYWTPEAGEHELDQRVIVPFYHEGNLVGWTARHVGETKKRYHSEVASDYLFNNSIMYDRDIAFIVLVEGVFDALAVDGVGTMGARLNERQIAWLESFGKQIILVPDRDDEGQRLIDIALKRGWMVAFPALSKDTASGNWWEPDVKDSAEAVRRYGRLYTLTSIIKSATDNPMAISMKRKLLV